MPRAVEAPALLASESKPLEHAPVQSKPRSNKWCPVSRKPGRWEKTYGLRLLLFLTVVNLLYGITTSWFIYINNYYLSKDLGLTPSQTQSAVATTAMCIIVRPVLGFVSDSVPIIGSTRRAYFFIAAWGSACCYFVLAWFEPQTELAPEQAIAVLCVANVLGYAWCGVILYAIVATEQRHDPLDGAAHLNALQWGFYSTGALLGDLSEGVLLKMLGSPHQCYWLMFALWSVMGLCALLYEEGRKPAQVPILNTASDVVVISRQLQIPSDERRPESHADAPLHARLIAATVDESFGQEDISASVSVEGNSLDTPLLARPETDLEVVLEMPEEMASEEPSTQGGFGVQMNKLWITLDPTGPTRGAVLSAVLYIFLTWAVVPDVSSGITYFFYTGKPAAGGLGFGAVTYSMLSVVGDISMLCASYIYGTYLGSTPLRRLFIGLQLMNVTASVLDLALALRWNERIGIDAEVFAGLDQAIFYLAWQLKNLPVYTLAAKVCPPGVEATLTACIAGMNDLSGSLAQFFGAALTNWYGVSATDFENVWLVYLVRTVCKLLPIPLVILVPSEEQLAGAMQALNGRLSLVDAAAKAQRSVGHAAAAEETKEQEIQQERSWNSLLSASVLDVSVSPAASGMLEPQPLGITDARLFV
jgi:hypothetical protein